MGETYLVMRALLVVLCLVAASVGQSSVADQDLLCKNVPARAPEGVQNLDPQLAITFSEQMTRLSDVWSKEGGEFMVAFDGGSKPSLLYWSVCQPAPVSEGCGPSAGCCQVFADGSGRECASYTSDASAVFVFDDHMKYQNEDVFFVGGVTLRYNQSSTTVPSNSFGLKGLPGNPNVPLCFEMDIKSNPLVPFLLFPQADAVYAEGGICLRARIDSQYGCFASSSKKFLHLTSWKVLFYILAPVAMFAGLLLCLFGWRLFRITSLVLGLFFGLTMAGIVILFSVFLACEATKPDTATDFWNWSHECTFTYLTQNAYVGWLASASGLIFGLGLAILAYRKPAFGGVLIGMAVGAWVSDLLYVTTFSVLNQHWIVLLLSSLFIPLFAMLGSCLPNSWKRAYYVIIISFTGGYLFCWGVGAYTQFFPSVVLLNDLGPKWQYILFAIAITVLGFFGSIAQFPVTGAFDWDTLMESGLCPGRSTKRRAGKVASESLLAGEQDVEMDEKTKNIINR